MIIAGPLLSSPGDRPPPAPRARRVPNRSAPGVLRPVLARLVWRLLRECAPAVSLGRESSRAAHASAGESDELSHTGYSTDPRWYSRCRHARVTARARAFGTHVSRAPHTRDNSALFDGDAPQPPKIREDFSLRFLEKSSSREGDENGIPVFQIRREPLRSQFDTRSLDHDLSIFANLDPWYDSDYDSTAAFSSVTFLPAISARSRTDLRGLRSRFSL